MKILSGFTEPAAYRGGYVAIGNFDGVHRGHQAMAKRLVEKSRAAGVPATVMTFDPHPIALLRPSQAPDPLSTLEHKCELLAKHGVDCIVVYPTDFAFLQLTPREFFDRVVRKEFQARGLVEGPNFFFGHDRAGDVALLATLCEEAGLTLDVVPPVTVGGQLVSSSVIRKLVVAGDVAGARDMLGHPYRVQGTVVRGAARGQTIGFPTANLAGIATLVPPDGVYAGVVPLKGITYPAAVNIGPNPTFGGTERKVEVHLLDFAGDLYAQTVALDLLERLRSTQPFENVAALQRQIQEDVARARAVAERFLPG